MNKYEINEAGRCVALRDFGDVKAGDVGGFVGKWNLSHERDCWVYNDARVSGEARIYCNAKILGQAEVYGQARVSDNAQVLGYAKVFEWARISGSAQVLGYAEIFGHAQVFDYAEVLYYAKVTGKACGLAQVWHDLSGEAIVIHGLLPWVVTVTDDYIKVGCVCKSKGWWRRSCAKDFHHMDHRADKLWHKHKTIIRELVC